MWVSVLERLVRCDHELRGFKDPKLIERCSDGVERLRS